MNTDYDENVRKEAEKPFDKRNKIINKRGKEVCVRKQHLSDEQMEVIKERYVQLIENVSTEIKKAANKEFFNPYRQKGIYFAQVQALFLLKANKWHSYNDIAKKLKVIMSKIVSKNKKTVWENFSGKSERKNAAHARDLTGRIQHNFRVLQRLKGHNPYGLRLAQVGSAIDIKREKDGIYHYRLNTKHQDKKVKDIAPIYDISAYQSIKSLEEPKKTGTDKKKSSSKKVQKKNVVIRKDITNVPRGTIGDKSSSGTELEKKEA